MREMSPSDLSVLAEVKRRPATASLPLDAHGLRYECDGKLLLDIPRLRINGGGPTIILGPNGAGKSVLVRLLHGLLDPTAGRVTLAGRLQEKADRARQAMVFQRPVLLRRSVAANLTFALRARGVPRQARPGRARLLLRIAELSDQARQPARVLSGGEEQRLALICALAGQPDLLFLDEPTSNLDPGATQRLETLIAAAAQAGTKVIMVTHDIGQARRLGQDVIFLKDGKLAEHTPAAQFFSEPATQPARAFVEGQLVI